MSLPLAHAGHYIEGLIFAVPVIVVILMVFGDSWRERRARRSGERRARRPG